jgi:hypothetical protein
VIALFESGEVKLRSWSHQVIAHGSTEAQKLHRHHRTYRMHAAIFGAGVAVAIAIKTSHRGAGAKGEVGA